MPHAVERVEGSMDPREGRLVLHGHIGESGPVIAGALPAEVVVEVAARAFGAFTSENFVDGYHGPLTTRIDIQPDGQVAAVSVLLDRVIHQDAGDRRWPIVLGDLVRRLAALSFPPAGGPTELVLPIIFGQLLPPH
jgi:hypothetical protein